MIKIIDYGMGNTASMLNMLRKAGGQAELSLRNTQVVKFYDS